VFFGHIHLPEHIGYLEGIYCNLGAWLKHYTYATMEDGELSLQRYHDDGAAEPIPLNSLK
jgi:UDP-2,3-diacylglucosamine pyrophosphatase LpxH